MCTHWPVHSLDCDWLEHLIGYVCSYQPCPVSICLDYAGPQVSVAVIIVTIIAVVYCCVLHLPSPPRVGRVA